MAAANRGIFQEDVRGLTGDQAWLSVIGPSARMRQRVDNLPLIESSNLSPPEQPQLPVTLSANRGIVRAAVVLAVGNVISRVLGLFREIVKSNMFGTSDLLASYTVAALVPITLFNLISGGEMVSSSLVPVFSDYTARERRGDLWHLASTFLSLALIILVGILLLVEFFAPQVAWLAGARNFEDQSLLPQTVELMRLATPAVLFLSIASILTGLLFALNRFTLPAFTTAVFNGTIVVVVLLRPDRIDSLVWGLLLGAFLQVALQLPALRDGRYSLILDWRHPAVRRIVLLYSPIVAGLVINQIAIWISYNLAITTGDNSVTFMLYATTLYQFPLGLVVTALSIATLPTLSTLATSYREAFERRLPEAGRRLDEYKETLAGGLRLVITLGLPAAAGLFALAGPIIALLFEHGEFTPDDTLITTRVLRVYLIGLPFAAVDQMLVFASYARKDTWRPALVGVISIAIYTVTAVILLRTLGLLSLMVADAVKHVVHTAIMLWLLARHVGWLSGYHMTSGLAKSLIASLLIGLIAYVAAESLSSVLTAGTLLQKAILVAIPSLAGLLTYIGLVFALNIRDAKSLRILLRKR